MSQQRGDEQSWLPLPQSTTRARGGAPATTWGDLGLAGEWADKPIHIYGIKPWNGCEEFIRQRVPSTPGWRNKATRSPSPGPHVARPQGTTGTRTTTCPGRSGWRAAPQGS